MANLTRKQITLITAALHHAQRAQRYIEQPGTVVAVRCRQATTTLHYTRPDGDVLYSINKDIGSDLTGLPDAIQALTRLLDNDTRARCGKV